jgi:hypothetical protein
LLRWTESGSAAWRGWREEWARGERGEEKALRAAWAAQDLEEWAAAGAAFAAAHLAGGQRERARERARIALDLV